MAALILWLPTLTGFAAKLKDLPETLKVISRRPVYGRIYLTIFSSELIFVGYHHKCDL